MALLMGSRRPAGESAPMVKQNLRDFYSMDATLHLMANNMGVLPQIRLGLRRDVLADLPGKMSRLC